jgi:uncharacterized protein DUF3237
MWPAMKRAANGQIYFGAAFATRTATEVSRAVRRRRRDAISRRWNRSTTAYANNPACDSLGPRPAEKAPRTKGPNIAGEILPGRGDWLLTGSDGIGRVEARVMIRTDDNALISFTAGGLIRLPPDGFRRLAAGERLPVGETYARTTPKFETSAERYGRISTVVTIGYNLLSPDHVDYRVYKVL